MAFTVNETVTAIYSHNNIVINEMENLNKKLGMMPFLYM